MLASDDTTLPSRRLGHGSGHFPSTEYHVIVPNALITLEALLRIYARDDGTRIGSFALATICYMMEYVENEGFLDGSLLSEPFGTSYRELKEGAKPLRQCAQELKDILSDDNEPFQTPAHIYEGEPVCGYVYTED